MFFDQLLFTMKLSLPLLGIFSLIGWLSLFAQSGTTVVQFEFTFAGEPLILDKPYYSPSMGDSIQLETIRFYVSDPLLVFDNQQIIPAEERYYLLDVSVPGSLAINFPNPDSIPSVILRFNIGIDSLTNVDGARGGALDPVNGLYWSWQSGYINTKIEGTSPSCPARHNRFQFHLGGYQSPNNCLQKVAVKVPLTPVIRIEIDLATYFQQVNLLEVYQIMSPSSKAVILSGLFAKSFKPLP